VLALTVKPAKQEKDNSEKTPLATANTLDITEEVPEDSTAINITENPPYTVSYPINKNCNKIKIY